ncbi:MBL fold metallo-hydrolase [Rubrobacter tropicus]|uniref:MBL fold metallo-hydrolase n=1 Tax=Rubrobacter tropicus TaxID=2653851 RepID=UPI001D187BEA|nr:MBL fold metallo-hydrolase [Rubrobacter tropicus]
MLPAGLATQSVGEAAEVVEGVWQIKLPVPFPLGFVAVYLIEGTDGWTLVDAGYDYPPAREAWKAGAYVAGCDLSRDVSRIVVTHFHPDHIGAARWLQEVSAAPVFMLEAEIPFARRLWGSPDAGPFVDLLVRHGMPPEMAEKGAAGMRSGLALPEELSPLSAGEKVPLGDGAARVLHAPGHADHQLVLHDEGRGILYAADHLMLGITPNVGIWPETDPHPLARYLASLEEMRGLGADLVLPGHGPVFHDLQGRVAEISGHHAERLNAMRATLGAGPRTPYEVSRIVFRGTLSVYQRCFALAETLAHLDQLALEGRARAREDEPVTYEAA